MAWYVWLPILLLTPFVLWMLAKRQSVRIGGLGLKGRMRTVPSRSPDRLVYRRWVWHPMVGLLVLLAGWAVLAWRPDSELAQILAVPLFAVAAFFLLLRKGLVIERQEPEVKRWWRLLVPLFSTTMRRAPFERVVITGEKRAAFFFFWDVCEVSLAITGEASQIIDTDCGHDRAVALGEGLARFLGIPLMDYSADPDVVRMPPALQASLRERVERGRLVLRLPDEPKRTRSRQTIRNESLCFTMPAAGVWPRRLCALLVALVVPTALLYATGRLPGLIEGGHLWVLAGLYAVTCVVGIGSAPRLPWRGWHVEASPEELRVTRRGLLGSRTRSLPADAVRSVEIVATRSLEHLWFPSWLARTRHAIAVRGGDEFLWFAYGLPRQELEWIKASLEVALTA